MDSAGFHPNISGSLNVPKSQYQYDIEIQVNIQEPNILGLSLPGPVAAYCSRTQQVKDWSVSLVESCLAEAGLREQTDTFTTGVPWPHCQGGGAGNPRYIMEAWLHASTGVPWPHHISAGGRKPKISSGFSSCSTSMGWQETLDLMGRCRTTSPQEFSSHSALMEQQGNPRSKGETSSKEFPNHSAKAEQLGNLISNRKMSL